MNKKGPQEHYPVGDGDHDVTVTTGPSYQNRCEAVGEFLDTLIENLPNLPIAPPAAAKFPALAIQMKELGPKGDPMAETAIKRNGSRACKPSYSSGAPLWSRCKGRSCGAG